MGGPLAARLRQLCVVVVAEVLEVSVGWLGSREGRWWTVMGVDGMEEGPRRYRRRWNRRTVYVHTWILLFPFRPTILEPNFYLRFGQGQGQC